MRRGMYMQSVPLVLVLVVISFPTLAMDITNKSGQIFQNVKIEEVRPDGLNVFHSKGVAFLPFRELPETIQKEYGYDLKKENIFLRRQAEAYAKRQAQQRESEAMQMIEKSGLKAELKVIQITDEGALVTGTYTKEEEYEDKECQTVRKVVGLNAPGRPGTIEQQVLVNKGKKKGTTTCGLPDRIFVIGIPSNLVDNDRFATTIYPCGRHQYVTVLGANATIDRYATSPTVARKLLGL